MIQINLVPDIKQEMLRAQRMRNLTISLSILAGIIAGGAIVALGVILGAQTAVEAYTSSQIKSEFQKLSSTKDINNALTIQNQLATISGQNDKRSMDSRLLDLLAAINPAAPDDVKLSKITLDPKESTLMLEGSVAGGYPSTEVFRKTILNTVVSAKQNGETKEIPLTNEVKLQNTSLGQDANGSRVVRFTITFVYPDGLFTNELQEVKIQTPTSRIDVTDSKSRVPDSMFVEAADDTEEGR